MFVAVTGSVLVLPTVALTEMLFSVTVNIAETGCAGGGSGLGAEALTPPAQPAIHEAPARRVKRNTRATPRFGREEFNVVFLFRILTCIFFAAVWSNRCASNLAWTGTRVREC
jgi:hypothetical protein